MISRIIADFIDAAVVVHAYRKYAPAMPPPDSLEMRALNELGNWSKVLDERDRRGASEVPAGVIDGLRRITEGWRVSGRDKRLD